MKAGKMSSIGDFFYFIFLCEDIWSLSVWKHTQTHSRGSRERLTADIVMRRLQLWATQKVRVQLNINIAAKAAFTGCQLQFVQFVCSIDTWNHTSTFACQINVHF